MKENPETIESDRTNPKLSLNGEEKENQKVPIWQRKRGMQVGITLLFSILATAIFLLLRMSLHSDLSKLYLPLLAFPLNIFVIRIIFPKKLGIPFGKISPHDFSDRIGLSKPNHTTKFIILGVLLGVCSLSGMLIGSIIGGQYQFDPSALTLEQVVFATVPGVWEEVFFRGILMLVLLGILKDLPKAALLQVVLFGLFHLSGFEFWTIVDVISVMLIGGTLTYTAHKTNSLLPGIVFHFLHDAFLFLVQPPGGEISGNFASVVFFASLWIMLGVACLLTKFCAEKWGVQRGKNLYDQDKIPNLSSGGDKR